MDKHWWEERLTELNKELWSIEEEYGESCRRINALIKEIQDGEGDKANEY